MNPEIKIPFDCTDWILDANAKNTKTITYYIGAITSLEPLEYWSYARVKWDGCIDLHKACNAPFSKFYGFFGDSKRIPLDDDYLHICILTNEIESLTKLQKCINENFKEYEG